MKKWIRPEIRVFSVKLDENIAASEGIASEKLTGEFWYTGQGDGNRITGIFYYYMDGTHKMVQDTYKAGGNNNIQKPDVAGAIASCLLV